LNLNHFKTVEDMALKLLHRGPLEWHYLRAKFHQNLPSGSKVISGGHIDRQTGGLISLLSILESRLTKINSNRLSYDQHEDALCIWMQLG
jgi:hypothetical protein